MAALILKGNELHKEEMEYQGKFGHNLGRIQQISFISRIDIFYATCLLATRIVAPTIPGFQCIKKCDQYMASHPNKPIFHPSHSYYGSNVIGFTWSGNQVEYYTTQNCLECHQDSDHARIINRIRSV